MVETIDTALDHEADRRTHISRAEYTERGKEAGLHRHQIDSSWYYLANDYVYAKSPENRPSYRGYVPRYEEGDPIALEFAQHPNFDHRWRDDEVAEVDGLDPESLAEYVRNAFAMADARKMPIEKYLGRSCNPGWVEFWQKMAAGADSRSE